MRPAKSLFSVIPRPMRSLRRALLAGVTVFAICCFLRLTSTPSFDVDAGGEAHSAIGGEPGTSSWFPNLFQSRTRPSWTQFDDDGLLRGWDGFMSANKGHGSKHSKRNAQTRDDLTRHPIEILTERGLDKWNRLLARQSVTLNEAVAEYQRRYRRDPPRGFDEWWAFCQREGVKIVDDYDQIDRDISLYFALSPTEMRARVEVLRDQPFTFHIKLSPTSPSNITGDRSFVYRATAMFQLLEPLAMLLPTELELHFSDHDAGTGIMGDDQRELAMNAIESGRYLTDAELTFLLKGEGRRAVRGLTSACPEGSPAWNQSVALKDGLTLSTPPFETAFVHDPRPRYDFCLVPDNLVLHGALSFDYSRDTKVKPIFQHSKFVRNTDFLTTALQAYENRTSTSAQAKSLPWEKKTVAKLFWRGSSTGDSYTITGKKGRDWRNSHRPRLHLLCQDTTSEREVWVQRGRGWAREKWATQRLNAQYMNVGLTGKVHQCRQEDGTCDEMASEIVMKERVSPEEAAKYKYVIDVDGNGWSSRFHRLLMSGSVAIKHSIYPDWNSDWLTPWVHYIPTQIDYSDLYNIMAFFIGSPDGRSPGRDDMARAMTERAEAFGLEHWRWQDMQAYMLRLLLEYARLLADDRESWSYPGDGDRT